MAATGARLPPACPPLPSQRRSAPSLHAAASNGPAADGWQRTANTWPGCQRSGIGPAREGCKIQLKDAFDDSCIAFRIRCHRFTRMRARPRRAAAGAQRVCGFATSEPADCLPQREATNNHSAIIMTSPLCQRPRCYLCNEVRATRRRRASAAHRYYMVWLPPASGIACPIAEVHCTH